MPQGRVKWFNAEKGFGFIHQQDGGRDIFVHRSAVEGLGADEVLREEERVEFNVVDRPKGLQAVDVKRLDEA